MLEIEQIDHLTVFKQMTDVCLNLSDPHEPFNCVVMNE